MTLPEYFDFAFQELYSLEDMLASFGQAQLADVLKSVVEMAYGKLGSLDYVMERDVGDVQVQISENGEPERIILAGKPKNESIH
jgi:hypothetical protein